MKFDNRVVVGEPEQAVRAQHEAGHNLARQEILAPAGNYAPLQQFNNAIGEQLSMHAKVFLAPVGQQSDHRIGDGADAHLQSVAISYQVGHVSAYPLIVRWQVGRVAQGQFG